MDVTPLQPEPPRTSSRAGSRSVSRSSSRNAVGGPGDLVLVDEELSDGEGPSVMPRKALVINDSEEDVSGSPVTLVVSKAEKPTSADYKEEKGKEEEEEDDEDAIVTRPLFSKGKSKELSSFGHGGDGGDEEEEIDPEDVQVELDEGKEEIALLTEDLADIFLNPLVEECRRVSKFFSDKLEELNTALADVVEQGNERKTNGLNMTTTKKDFLNILVDCEELIDFSKLNLIGFMKIIKKFVRKSNFMGRSTIITDVESSDFVARLPAAEDLHKRIVKSYEDMFSETKEDRDKYHQEIISSVKAARSWKMNTILSEVEQRNKNATVNEVKAEAKWLPMAGAILVFTFFMFVPMFPLSERPAQRACGVLLASIILWVSEAAPLFATSILCAFLCAISHCFLDDNGKPLDIVQSSQTIFTLLFPSNVPLVLAGFCISAAFKKYQIDMIVAKWMLSRKVFQTPKRFIIAVEILCFFMSAWVTNIAGAVLTLTVIMPIIRDLPQNCVYIRTLLMATCISGSIGGMPTQIASPQNAVTANLGEGTMGFLDFIVVALPVWPVMLVISHLIIMHNYPPDIEKLPTLGGLSDSDLETTTGYASATLNAMKEEREAAIGVSKKKKAPWKIIATLFISLFSIILWICSNWLSVFGKDIGLISFIPIVLFFCSGLLDTQDYQNLPWPLIMLLSGGNVLGYAVQSSKLLQLIAKVMNYIPHITILIILVCNVIITLAASLVSSTVSAIILLPLLVQMGLMVGHPRVVVMCAVVMCSASNMLPISSFPNMSSCNVRGANGEQFLTTQMFVKTGLPVTFVGYICCSFLPYLMCLALGM